MGAAYLKGEISAPIARKPCDGKPVFFSRAEALNNRVVKQRNHLVFECEHCGQWHSRERPVKGRNA